ncbi:fumarate hydratase C-terminal domain-containing protein [Klebsiella variicola subsp. variicola]|nr:fumarate hydratase C-terminal domain-containing protein [Klebsiella variicola subsp. variicola]
MLAKGNRSQQVTDACHKHGGFYLRQYPAARRRYWPSKHPQPRVRGVSGGWVWRLSGKIEVEDFPAFILVDDKGNDFFQQIQTSQCARCVK